VRSLAYSANQAFRVRIDIEDGGWSFALDDESNGFGDNVIISNLPFVNPLLSSPGAVNASFSIFPVIQTGASAAYDNFTIAAVPEPSILVLLGCLLPVIGVAAAPGAHPLANVRSHPRAQARAVL
jgi:hypothetical protein